MIIRFQEICDWVMNQKVNFRCCGRDVVPCFFLDLHTVCSIEAAAHHASLFSVFLFMQMFVVHWLLAYL